MSTSRAIWPKASRWSSFAFTLRLNQSAAGHHLRFSVSITTKGVSQGRIDPAHQDLINRILALREDGLTSRQIADRLNEQGLTSWGGKRFYPELVFGVIRKAQIKRDGLSQVVTDTRCEFEVANASESSH